MVASTDAGEHWHEIGAPSGPRLTDLLFPSAGGSLLLATDEGVFQTGDDGQTWTPAHLPTVRSIASSSPAALMFVSSPDGAAFETPRRVGDHYEIYGVVATADNGFLAATSRGLMRADGIEKTWRPMPGSLEGGTVTAICRHPTRAGVFFASQFGVIFVSYDEGRTWAKLPEADDGTEIITELVAVAEIPNRIFALTRSRGIYAVPLP